MDTRIRDLLTNTFLFAVANMGSKILVFLMVPLYTVVLSTEEYGVSDMVQTTAQMLFPVLTCMISDAVLRFCFLKDYRLDLIFSIGSKITIIGLLISLVLCLFFRFLPLFESIGNYIFFIPLFFFNQSTIQLLHKFARGIDKVKASAYAGLISTLIVIVLNLLFLLVFKIGLLGYLLAYSIADLVAIAFLAISCDVKKYLTKEKNKQLRSEMLRYSFPLAPNQISWWALSSINRYIMLAWLGVSAVGIYSATLRIPTILTVISDIFAQAWLLTALKDYGSDESKKFISNMHTRYFGVLIIATSLIILLSYPLAKLLLSGEFSTYWAVTPLLFISVFLGGLVGFLGSIFSAERKNKMQLISTIVGALLSIIITIIFLKHYGVITIAFATWAGYLIIWLIRRIAVSRYIKLSLSILNSLLQGGVLFVQALLVMNECYFFAMICVIIIIILNYKNVMPILKFAQMAVYEKLKK